MYASRLSPKRVRTAKTACYNEYQSPAPSTYDGYPARAGCLYDRGLLMGCAPPLPTQKLHERPARPRLRLLGEGGGGQSGGTTRAPPACATPLSKHPA